MPVQGEIKWTAQFISDKKTVVDMLEAVYINIDQLGSNELEAVATVAPYFLGGISGKLASLGGDVVSMTLSSFKTKCKTQIISCLNAIAPLASGRQVAIMAKYMWTEKEGGNWMPQYEIKHLVVQTA